MSSHNRELGQRGEQIAAEWYEAAGFAVLDRNWRTTTGEIDLICASGTMVVFSEVKTRSSDRFGAGVEAVTAQKQLKIRAVAGEWLRASRSHYKTLRFDVADVDGRGHIVVYENCF